MTAACGKLHLLPVPLIAPRPATPPRDAAASADYAGAALDILPAASLAVARRTEYFLAENSRSARAFLKAIAHPRPIASLRIEQIGHAPDPQRVDGWLAPLLPQARPAPIDAAIIAEAGCPAIADPGASLVARAHALGIPVQPWVGPSSLLLALMGAGMNGQAFRFLGYLPQERNALQQRLIQVEQDAWRGETQMFIETPYRSGRLFQALLQTCAPGLSLCLAVELTGVQQQLATRSIAQWRALRPQPDLERRAAVFLLHGAGGRS